MKVFDENWNEIESPDLEVGAVEMESVDVIHTWIVDSPEQSHERVLAVYPETGGKDVEIVIDEPEQGHWETRGMDGNLLPCDDVPDDLSKDNPVQCVWDALRYRLLTEEELSQRAEQRKRKEEERELKEQREAFLESAPERLTAAEECQSEADDALCALYEESLQQQTILSEQDDAICELYELVRGGD